MSERSNERSERLAAIADISERHFPVPVKPDLGTGYVCFTDEEDWPCDAAAAVSETEEAIAEAIAQDHELIKSAVRRLRGWDKRSVPGGIHVNRRAVLNAIDHPEWVPSDDAGEAVAVANQDNHPGWSAS